MEIVNEILFYAVPLIIAMIAGIVIGLERELRDRSGGFRTMVLVALSAAALVFVPDLLREIGIEVPMLIPMAFLSFGFLSAAVILKLGANSNGLTTAASVWLVALLGLISASGHYLLVGIIVLLTMIVVWLFPFIEKLIGGRYLTLQLDVTIKNKDAIEDEVLDIMDELKIKVLSVTRTRMDATERIVHLSLELTEEQRKDLSEIIVNEKSILKFSI